MRKLLALFLLAVLLVMPVSAEIAAPTVPEAGQKLMPRETESFSQGLRHILKELLPILQPELTQGLRTGAGLVAVCMLLSLLRSGSPEIARTADLVGAVSIGTLLFAGAHTMIRLGADTVTQMSEYEKLLLPAATAAMAAQGGLNSATALYAGSALFNTVLSALLVRLLLPVQYLYLATGTAEAALGSDALKNLKKTMKDLIFWCMKTLLSLFTAYLGITGVVSGTTDAAVVKAAKTTISSVIPVVGGILSDASEAVLVGTGLLRNAVGIYGILAILAVFLGPFGRIGVQFLILKGAACLCAIFGSKHDTELIDDFSEVMRMLLGMTGAMCLLLLVSSVCFLKGVG